MSRRASSSRAYRNTTPGPPSSHLRPPAVGKSTPLALREPLVGDRGEVERGDDDPTALAIVECLRHGRERDGDARAERDLLGGRADHARVAPAQLRERRPPHVVPGGRAALLPEIEELGDAPASPLPQGAQGAGIEVDLVPEDRELAPIAGERMGAGLAGRREAACERHRRSIYRRSRGLDTARDDTRPLHRACRLQTAMRTPTRWPSLSLRLALRALANPRLAVDLLRLAWSFRARGWYRHPPFLPLPPREYIR